MSVSPHVNETWIAEARFMNAGNTAAVDVSGGSDFVMEFDSPGRRANYEKTAVFSTGAGDLNGDGTGTDGYMMATITKGEQSEAGTIRWRPKCTLDGRWIVGDWITDEILE